MSYEPRRLELCCGEGMVCELVAVVRCHLDSMPGSGRDRPGVDRVHLRLTDGREIVTDVWSRGDQDLRQASGSIRVFDHGDVVAWATVAVADVAVEPANDGGDIRLVG